MVKGNGNGSDGAFFCVDGMWFFGYNLSCAWRVVRVVEGAALEMLCGETHLGFESLTLRQGICGNADPVFVPRGTKTEPER